MLQRCLHPPTEVIGLLSPCRLGPVGALVRRLSLVVQVPQLNPRIVVPLAEAVLGDGDSEPGT